MEVTTMDKCNKCGKEYKRLDIHIKKAHGLTQEEYSELPEYEEELKVTMELDDNMTEEEAKAIIDAQEVEEDKEPIAVKGQEQIDNIFADSVEDLDPDKAPISTVLAEFSVTYKELRGILKNYTKGTPLDVNQEIERQQKVGMAGAEELKNQASVDTTVLTVAETLTKKYGFTVTSVTSDPKTWHLIKQ